MLGAPRLYTRDEAVALAGVDLERARRYWRALGFADTSGEVAFTEADVDALRRVLGLVESGALSEELALGLTRALGHTLGRLASWQVDVALDQLVGPPGAAARPDVGLAEGYAAAEQLLPDLERLLVYAWRRQLAATVTRVVEDAEPSAAAARLSVAFADLVGFTRLSRRLREHELGEVVERFEQRGSDIVTAAGARLLKTLGDEVLFVAEDPRAAVAAALDLVEHFHADESMPELRIGIGTGPVLYRMGDIYGTTVNRASRLTSLARPGTVLCDAETVEQLDDPHLVVNALWRRPVRGLGLVEPHAVRRLRSDGHGTSLEG